MHRLSTNRDLTFFSRYECKYLVSPLILPQFREFIHPFTKPDHFAAKRPGFRYPICSLYLDTDDLRLYQQTVGGEKNRFKLRIRTYSDEAQAPVFFEVKRKQDSIVQKRRARLDRKQASTLLARGVNGWMLDLPEHLMADVEYFSHRTRLAGAKPVVRVKYVREAYESRAGDPLRITIDTELMHAITLDDSLTHGGARWVTTPVDGVIIEIKFTERYPWWVSDLVRTFGLTQQPVPKYVLSLDHALLEGREAVLSLAGFTLPPRRA